ncbi:hypothetical protein P691DRAFT_831686, partial [Macrolepiota fuliginosa MF-IS2]
ERMREEQPVCIPHNVEEDVDDKEKVFGMLNDWDLASNLADGAQEVDKGWAWTGMIPFAALDLLNKTFDQMGIDLQLYCFDAKSFKWVLLYSCLNTLDNEKYLREWCNPDHSHDKCSTFLSETNRWKPRDGWEKLYTLACDFMSWFIANITGRVQSV